MCHVLLCDDFFLSLIVYLLHPGCERLDLLLVSFLTLVGLFQGNEPIASRHFMTHTHKIPYVSFFFKVLWELKTNLQIFKYILDGKVKILKILLI